MTEAEIEVLLQRAREKYPEAKPRIISDNGPQFIARDFKEFIRIAGMTHVRTSPYYPQSNGKLERWHKSLKSECIRPGTPLTREDALRLIQTYVDHYNRARPHSSLGPGIPEPSGGIPVPQISGHSIPYRHRVVGSPVLGGLHHEYRLEKVAA
jgi:transposase InsO family protein